MGILLQLHRPWLLLQVPYIPSTCLFTGKGPPLQLAPELSQQQKTMREATRGQEKGSWLWKLWSWESLVPLWVPRTPVPEEPHDLAGQEGTKLHGRANTLLTNSLTLCLIGVKDKGNRSHRQARVQRCGFSRAKLTQALTAWPYVPSSKSKLRRFWLSCKPHGYPSKTAQYLVPYVYQATKSPLALREPGHHSVDRDQYLLTFSPSLSWDGFCSNTASTAQ